MSELANAGVMLVMAWLATGGRDIMLAPVRAARLARVAVVYALLWRLRERGRAAGRGDIVRFYGPGFAQNVYTFDNGQLASLFRAIVGQSE